MGRGAARAVTWASGHFRSTSQPSLGWAEVSASFLGEEAAFKQFWQMSGSWPPKGKGRAGSLGGDLTLGIQVPRARTAVPRLWGQGWGS